MTDYKPQEWQDLEELYRKQNVRINELEQCNLNLQEWLDNKEKVNKSLREENKKLREENEILRCSKGWTPEKVWHEEMIQYLMGENKKQKEETELLKQCLDKLMFDADVVNVKIHWELWDYVYVRSDKQFKLNVKD